MDREEERLLKAWYAQFTRRRFLQYTGAAMAGAMMEASGIGDVSESWAMPERKGGKVVWATLEANATPAFIKAFTKTTGTQVQSILVKSSQETLQKLITGGSGIDVMTDFNGHGGTTYQGGVIAPIDPKKVPNLNHLIPFLRTVKNGVVFNGKRYGTFMDWGTDSLAYVNHKGVGHTVNSIDILWDSSLKGKLAMPSNYFESIYVSALHLGFKKPYALTKAQLDEVKNDLLKQKPLLRTYWNAIGDLKNLFATGEVYAAWSWVPVLQARQENNVDIHWVNPKEGQLLFYNTNYMTKEAVSRHNQANSEALMNYLMGPNYQYLEAEKYQYRPSNQTAIGRLSKSLRHKLFLDDPNFLKNAKIFDAPVDVKAYQDTWDAVVNG
jgi:spermidine/putrescine transport system substrate-binding protein